MCPEGHRNPARHIGSKSFACLFILAPLSGRILAWRVPRVETLGSALLPLRGADLVPFPYVDADGQPPDVILAGSYYILINPFRSPAIAASVRLRAPNFCMMLFT
jgi:hypothetical protein